MLPSDPFVTSCGLGAQNCSKIQYFVVRCFCGGVLVVVFVWWCSCGCGVGGVFVVVFLRW